MKIQNLAILGAVATILITGSVFAAQAEMVLNLKDETKITLNNPTYIDKANEVLSSVEDIKIEEVLSKHRAIYTSETIGRRTIAAHMKKFQNLDADGKKDIGYNGLVKNELNIPLKGNEGVYISNMALVGNLLHVQLRSETAEGTGTIKLVNQEKNVVNVNTPVAHLTLPSAVGDSTYSEFIFYIENPEHIGTYKILAN